MGVNFPSKMSPLAHGYLGILISIQVSYKYLGEVGSLDFVSSIRARKLRLVVNPLLDLPILVRDTRTPFTDPYVVIIPLQILRHFIANLSLTYPVYSEPVIRPP